MATFTILAGDFGKTRVSTITGTTLRFAKPVGTVMRSLRLESLYESVHASQIAGLEIVNRGTVEGSGGAAAGGVGVGQVLGDVEAIGELLTSGREDSVSFRLTLRDGRELLGLARPRAFHKIQTAELACRGQEPPTRLVARLSAPLTQRGIAIRVGLVALLVTGVFVGLPRLMANMGL